mgnify:CR=1 FL=1
MTKSKFSICVKGVLNNMNYTAWQMNADTYCGYDIWNKGTVHIELNDYKDWRWVISYAYFLGFFSNSFEFSSVLYNHITIQINKILWYILDYLSFLRLYTHMWSTCYWSLSGIANWVENVTEIIPSMFEYNHLLSVDNFRNVHGTSLEN